MRDTKFRVASKSRDHESVRRGWSCYDLTSGNYLENFKPKLSLIHEDTHLYKPCYCNMLYDETEFVNFMYIYIIVLTSFIENRWEFSPVTFEVVPSNAQKKCQNADHNYSKHFGESNLVLSSWGNLFIGLSIVEFSHKHAHYLKQILHAKLLATQYIKSQNF